VVAVLESLMLFGCTVWFGRVYCSFVIVFEDNGFVGSVGLVVVFCKSFVLVGGVVVATIASGLLQLLGDLTWLEPLLNFHHRKNH
jgi:hypothetical protein